MKTLKLLGLGLAIFHLTYKSSAQQKNFAISNEDIEIHQAHLENNGLPFDEGNVVYSKTFEELNNASTAILFGAFVDWYQSSFGQGGFLHSTQDSHDQSRGWEEIELIWRFRFWNKGSYKAVAVKSVFRFYAKEGRARVVHERFLFNLSEADLLTPSIVRNIRAISRAADRIKSNDPHYPYTVEEVDAEKDQSTMKKRLIVAFDLANRMLLDDLEAYLRNYLQKLDEGDDW